VKVGADAIGAKAVFPQIPGRKYPYEFSLHIRRIPDLGTLGKKGHASTAGWKADSPMSGMSRHLAYRRPH